MDDVDPRPLVELDDELTDWTARPGCVAVPTSEVGRFMLFTMSLAATKQPHGTRLHAQASQSICENLNSICRGMTDGDHWLWIMGDDHAWMGDTLMIMLDVLNDHPDVDILVPVCSRRNPPWLPVLYDILEGEYDDDGIQMLRQWHWDRLTAEASQADVFEVDAAGSAGMLIRRHVLETMGDPWWHSTPDKLGRQIVLNEDITFCLEARKLGFTVAATTRAVIGHIGIYNVVPVKKGGRWGALTQFSSPNEQLSKIFMPVTEDQLA